MKVKKNTRLFQDLANITFPDVVSRAVTWPVFEVQRCSIRAKSISYSLNFLSRIYVAAVSCCRNLVLSLTS